MPFASPPPLSINDALKAVENYWHYLIRLKSTIDNKPRADFFVVLMDGKVISAFKEPDSIK